MNTAQQAQADYEMKRSAADVGHTATPWAIDTIENEGDYGNGGPNCHTGFDSFAIVNSIGRILFDSLNRDVAICEVEESIDESSVYAWDRLAKRDAEFIVRACNSHQDLVDALKRALEDLEDTALLVQQGLARRENILRSIEIKAKAVRASLSKAAA